VGFFILEKYLWSHRHELKASGNPLALMNLIGDGLHNFIVGTIIAASYATDTSLGLSATVAVSTAASPPGAPSPSTRSPA